MMTSGHPVGAFAAEAGRELVRWGVFVALLVGLYATSQSSYVLFHSLVEVFRVVVLFGIAGLAWNARRQIDNAFLLLAGYAFPWVGLLELLHTLAYKGMGVFPADANLPTQFWIAFRAFESVALLIAALALGRRMPAVRSAGAFAVGGAVLVWATLTGRFPDCYVEGAGLTPFKIAAEYVIAGLFAAALIQIWQRRTSFDADVLWLVSASLVTDILAELAFTQYVSVYGPANLLGHLLLLASTYFLYRALMLKGVKEPLALLFKQLQREKELLARSEAELAVKVAQRTEQLRTELQERKRVEHSLRDVNRRLELLSASNQTLLHSATTENLQARMCRCLTDVGGYGGAWIGAIDGFAGHGLRFLAASDDRLAAEVRAAAPGWCGDDNPLARAVAARTPVVFAGGGPFPQLASQGAGLVLPLVGGQGVFACAVVLAESADRFTPVELRTLEELAGDLAFGFEGLRIKNDREAGLQRIAGAMADTVRAIAATVERRDPYTAGHQRRVAELAGAIARELGLDPERVRAIEMAATIHDLGKINIPSEILSKPANLTDIEFMMIKSHPTVGYEIIKDIEFPWPIAEAMLQHHERLDGSGYPAGLKGDAIALEARIIGVADVVEAMSSHRPYRPGLGIESALDSLLEGRGVSFDTDVVDACVRLFREKGFRFSDAWGDHR